MRRRSLSCRLWLWIGLLFIPGFVWGQGSNASISRTVADRSRAVVPSAQLTLRALGK